MAAKAGLRHLSPLLIVAIRQAGWAVVLVALVPVFRRSLRPLSGSSWLQCAVAEALLKVVGLMAPHAGRCSRESSWASGFARWLWPGCWSRPPDADW
jgi:hypothetical protein